MRAMTVSLSERRTIKNAGEIVEDFLFLFLIWSGAKRDRLSRDSLLDFCDACSRLCVLNLCKNTRAEPYYVVI